MKTKAIEYFPLVDEEGHITGMATRSECHSGTFLLHPVVHLHVFNSEGNLYLQKRAIDKDIQPGKWDTSVGGHVDYGETIEAALRREVGEELGITDFEPVFITRYKFVSAQEAELVHCFYTVYNGAIVPDPVEIMEGKFWSRDEIVEHLDQHIFTPNFENEYRSMIEKIHSEMIIKSNGDV